MRAETTYYACDDTEFSTEEECLAYEAKIMGNFNSAIFLTRNFEVIPTDHLEDIQPKSYYILIRSEEAKDLFEFIEDIYGFQSPEVTFREGDILKYDEDECEWFNLSERIYSLNEDLKAAEAVFMEYIENGGLEGGE